MAASRGKRIGARGSKGAIMKTLRFKTGILGTLPVLVAAMMLSTALAGGSPHFIKSATDVYIHTMGCLHCDFKEAGLSSGAVETIVLKGTAAVTFWSINGGDNHPQAANKETFVVQVRASGQFTADKNGNLVGFVCLPPPTAQEVGFQVPKGQTAVMVSIVYTNVMIVDETSGASLSFPGTFAYFNPAFIQ